MNIVDKSFESFSSRGLNGDHGFSSRFFQDGALTQSYADLGSRVERQPSPIVGDQMVIPDVFAPAPRVDNAPLLNSTIRQQIAQADSFKLTSASENQASGQSPDYRVVEGANGSLVLEKIADGDPLADGVLNIETDSNGKSLQYAIMQSDRGLKEYYRELIAAWRVEHPNEQFPGWWQDILNLQPAVSSDTQTVPIREAEPRAQAQQQAVEPRSTAGGEQRSISPFDNASYGGSGGGGGGGTGGGGAPDIDFNPSEQSRPAEVGSSSAVPDADQETVLSNVRTVVDVAHQVGVDPQLAVAMMLVESGGDNRAVGDRGTSFGLYQLHRGGMLTDAGLTREEAFDPRTNAEVSLGNLARIDDRYSDPGRAAAASQRPAHPADYARRVNASMDEAARLMALAGTPDTGKSNKAIA